MAFLRWGYPAWRRRCWGSGPPRAQLRRPVRWTTLRPSRRTARCRGRSTPPPPGGAAAAIVNRIKDGDFPQATQLLYAVTIPVVGISDSAGTTMGASGTLTWTDWRQNGFYTQGCGGGGICNNGTLALVDSVVNQGVGTEGGGVLQKSGTLTLA